MRQIRSCILNYKAGDKLGSYTLLAECGKGAYGSVFLAENALTRQQVALKIVYHAGRNSDRELKGLIKYQNLCKHTNLLQIYHVEGKENFFFYTMDAADNRNTTGDYVPDTLAKRLKENGRLDPEVVKKMAQELLGDLNVLHSKGLFHRDIKPDNILWIDGKATLGDIGLVTDSSQTLLAGTPGFISSEVISGTREFEAKDDFFALGRTIYCAVTGLPVSQYPEFPESGTLTNTGELIQLYNKLCAGEKTDFVLTDGNKRKRWFAGGIAVAILLFILAGIFIFYWITKQAPLPVSEVPAANPVAKTHTSPKIPAYQPSQAMLDLLPELRKHYQQLEMQMYTTMFEASKNISDQEIVEAERYLAQHPEEVFGSPQMFVSSQKSRQAEKDFDRQHQNDPVWCYFRNQQDIAFFTASLKGNTLPRYPVAEAQSKLRDLYRRQGELETAILKKYQK